MLDTSPPGAHPRACFPVAATPLSVATRDALLPVRLGPAWLLAFSLDGLIDSLDLSALFALYPRRGRLPYPPPLLLRLALFGIAEGLASPAEWADLANRDGPTRWLVLGIEPNASVCYAFRDRLSEEVLLELNRQLLALAQRVKLTQATRASLDGTLVEADASRHHLVNAERLERGLEASSEPPDASATRPSDQTPQDDSTQPASAQGATADAP